MKFGSKLMINSVAFGLGFGALALTGCGGSQPQGDAPASQVAPASEAPAGGEEKSCGGEKGCGGEKSCGG